MMQSVLCQTEIKLFVVIFNHKNNPRGSPVLARFLKIGLLELKSQ